MTLRQMKNELISKGYKVKFRELKGGSIVITEINGKKFKAKTGNAFVRGYFGQSLTESQTRQLSNIRKLVKPSKRKTKTPIDADIEKLQKRINERLRKSKSVARVYKKNIRYEIERYGIEATKRKLEQTERYSKGLAYLENIRALRNRIQSDNDKIMSSEIDELINELDVIIASGGLDFKEEYISIINSYLYELESTYNQIQMGAIDEYELEEMITSFVTNVKGLLNNAMRTNRKKKI